MKIRTIVACGLMVAMTAVLSQIAFPLPFSPVPVSLGVSAVFLCGGLLSPSAAILTQAAYLLLGAAGLPVFAGFQGGVVRLIGPTGGFLLAYPIMAACVALAAKASQGVRKAAPRYALLAGGMTFAMLLCYALGTAWFCIQQKSGLAAALSACVIPFLAPDAMKIALCTALVPVLRSRLARSGAVASSS